MIAPETTFPSGIRAAILGCAGLTLSPDERAFFQREKPYGFILFARNVGSPDQVRDLVTEMRGTVGWQAPVLIDQEGGRVQRMTRPHWRKYPNGAIFGTLYERDPGRAERLCRLNAHLLASDLAELGIDVDCLPLLDLPQPGAHDVIGARAFSADIAPTIALARAQVAGLADAGVTGVIKHIPGHGRAMADSHLDLPRIDTPLETLKAHDFPPFTAFADAPYGMTAHLLLTALDAERPSTTSNVVIEGVIRGMIGFKGLLMTDDLSMNALGGTLGERAAASIAAGCDLVLHCNGNMTEMEPVMAQVPELKGGAADRARRADALRFEVHAKGQSAPSGTAEQLAEALGASWPDTEGRHA